MRTAPVPIRIVKGERRSSTMSHDDTTTTGQQETLPGRDRETMTREAFEMAAQQDFDTELILVSGGTDSLVAADAVLRWGGKYGIEPEAICHVNTGVGLTVTRRTVQEFCAERDVPYIEASNWTDGEMLAHRVLKYGWPSHGTAAPGVAGGHQMEFINRKERVFDGIYRSWPGEHLWISGVRAAESDRRAGNVGDAPVRFGVTGGRKPRQSWLCPCHGWSDAQKNAHIDEFDIPVTPAYDFVGHSGECVACSFDHPTALNEIRMIDPELAFVLARLCVWVYQRIRNDEIDIPLHRSVWGWPRELETDSKNGTGVASPDEEPEQRTFSMVGCDDCSADGCYKPPDSDASFWPELN